MLNDIDFWRNNVALKIVSCNITLTSLGEQRRKLQSKWRIDH